MGRRASTLRRLGEGSPPAIVIGRGHTGLGTLRCLVDAGIPAYVACPADDLATRSRWYRPVPGAHWDGSVGAHAQQLLQEMPLDRAVLVPGADDAALWLTDLPDDARFPRSSSARGTLEILQDKQRFGRFLADTGVPHPRTFAISSLDDIAAIPLDALDRIFLKPVDSQRFSETLGVKGVWVNGAKELEAAWSRLQLRGFEVIAQEYVPGGADEHYFIDGFRDRHGRLPSLFARRRTRIFPADFGNSSYCTSIPLPLVQDAVHDLRWLLDKLDYRGIFSAEFKRDARNGEFRILEVNTRAWWYVEFAARCGVNVCEMAYLDALGEWVPDAASPYRTGIGCVNMVADVQSVLRHRSPRPGLLQVLRQWTHAYFHVLRADDPMPFLASFLREARHWCSRRLHRRAGAAAPETV